MMWRVESLILKGEFYCERLKNSFSIRLRFWPDPVSDGLFCCILKIYVVNKICLRSRYLAMQKHHSAWMYEELASVLPVIVSALPVFSLHTTCFKME